MCHSRQPGADIQQTLITINLLPEPSTQPSQDISLGLTSLGPGPSQEMWVTQGWQFDQNAWWIEPNHHPITHEQGGKNCQGSSVRCGEGNFWQAINAKEPAVIQVLPIEMGSYIYFFYDLPPFPHSWPLVLQYAAEKPQKWLFFSQILNTYAPQNLELIYTSHIHMSNKS